jgi:beta-fructofuranosidase
MMHPLSVEDVDTRRWRRGQRSFASDAELASRSMALGFEDRWIWDFWLVRAGEEHHVFYLQAPREIDHPDERHWHASIGHARSQDLRHWKVLPDALAPGPAGSWDDASTWTGSVISAFDRWFLLYTGTAKSDRGLVQRIGLAESDDLLRWRKHPEPVLEADQRWYETFEDRAWHDLAWRDPWVFVHPEDQQFHVFVTARTRVGDPGGRGVIGHARSTDLHHWQVLAPVTEPMGFGQMEVPQLVALGDRWYLVFCSDLATQGTQRRTDGPGTGTYYLIGDEAMGPFPADSIRALEADRRGSTYAGKLHTDSAGNLVFLAWHHTGADGRFRGTLSDPRPVAVLPDGALQLG